MIEREKSFKKIFFSMGLENLEKSVFITIIQIRDRKIRRKIKERHRERVALQKNNKN